jgi:hypothetical protein
MRSGTFNLLLLSLLWCGSARADGDRPAPAQPFVTTCDCVATNGVCQADCTIVCNSGYGDCNGSVADGCETNLNNPATCGTCDNDCTGCNSGDAVCNNGTCGGTPLPNGAACRPSQICFGAGGGGVCISGQCMCDTNIDMSGSPSPFTGRDMGHPSDISGDCSFAGGGSATAFVILMMGVVLLLNRRASRK